MTRATGSNWSVLGRALLGCVLAASAGCAAGSREHRDAPALPAWSYDSTMIFPASRPLARPEDGVMLPDGRLIVADERSGLRVVHLDGSTAPFGDMAAAGYVHRPPERSGGANGVSLEPGGTHVIVSDVLGGGIYRVEISSGRAEMLYQHRYGVNTAVRDSRGAVWFTQSAQNAPADGQGRLYAALDVARPEGALLRLASTDGRLADRAEVVVDSLRFANGLAIDEMNGRLYVAETTGHRVLRFTVDYEAGRLGERSVLMEDVMADNLTLADGQLWLVVPLTSELIAVNTSTGERHTAFQASTEPQRKVLAEFMRRGRAGEPRLELFTPAMWAPLPWPVTGVIVDGRGRPAYLTGLGDALLKLAPERQPLP